MAMPALARAIRAKSEIAKESRLHDPLANQAIQGEKSQHSLCKGDRRKDCHTHHDEVENEGDGAADEPRMLKLKRFLVHQINRLDYSLGEAPHCSRALRLHCSSDGGAGHAQSARPTCPPAPCAPVLLPQQNQPCLWLASRSTGALEDFAPCNRAAHPSRWPWLAAPYDGRVVLRSVLARSNDRSLSSH